VLPPDPDNNTDGRGNKDPTIADIININRYSTLSKLLYVTAYVLRFAECVKHHESNKPTATELSKVQMLWITSCQYSFYSKEINSLQKPSTGSRRLPLVRQLRLFPTCLLTCASTRAIHLEIATDLSEATFLQAFRRFAARRSLPRLVLSDNASTYTSTAKELNELLQSPTLKAALMHRGTTWRFIPKRAPWYGGFWERLVGIVKMTLKKTLG